MKVMILGLNVAVCCVFELIDKRDPTTADIEKTTSRVMLMSELELQNKNMVKRPPCLRLTLFSMNQNVPFGSIWLWKNFTIADDCWS